MHGNQTPMEVRFGRTTAPLPTADPQTPHRPASGGERRRGLSLQVRPDPHLPTLQKNTLQRVTCNNTSHASQHYAPWLLHGPLKLAMSAPEETGTERCSGSIWKEPAERGVYLTRTKTVPAPTSHHALSPLSIIRQALEVIQDPVFRFDSPVHLAFGASPITFTNPF